MGMARGLVLVTRRAESASLTVQSRVSSSLSLSLSLLVHAPMPVEGDAGRLTHDCVVASSSSSACDDEELVQPVAVAPWWLVEAAGARPGANVIFITAGVRGDGDVDAASGRGAPAISMLDTTGAPGAGRGLR